MEEQSGQGAGSPVTGGFIANQGARVIISGRVYTSTGGAARYHNWAQQDTTTEPEDATTTQPERTAMGLEVAHRIDITMKESEPLADDVREYEVFIDGKRVWSGLGEDRASALLEAITEAAGESEELPDR
jgi:hypothetical protein